MAEIDVKFMKMNREMARSLGNDYSKKRKTVKPTKKTAKKK